MQKPLMPKVITAVMVWLFTLSYAIAAESHVELQQRLSKVKSFSAQFVQTVTSADGSVLQQNSGKLWVQRPGLFRWQTTSPEENLLVSDGKTLWFYTPLVEQVTVTWLSSATENTPFLLISGDRPTEWRRYRISHRGDHFELIPRQPEENLQHFTLTINKHGVIEQFVLFEQDGQRSQFVLQKFRRGPINYRLFSFTPPPKVTMDDQR